MKQIFYVFGFLLFTLNVFAQTVKMGISKKALAIGEDVTLQIDVNEKPKSQPQFPDVKGLDIRYLGASTSMRSINFKTTYSYIFNFNISPVESGEFQVPAIEIEFDSGVKKTEAFTLKVYSAEEFAKKTGNAIPYFLETKLSTRDPYVGEFVAVDHKLYFKQDEGRLTGVDIEPVTGTNIKSYPVHAKDQGEEEKYGFPYVTIMFSHYIVPMSSGSLELPGSTGIVQFRPARKKSRRRSFFDDFEGFGGFGAEQKQMRSRGQSLTVKALPQEGKPTDFQGIVGNYTLTATVPKRDITVGENITLEFKVDGEGFVDPLESLSWNQPTQGVKIYKDKTEGGSEVTQAGNMEAHKTFRYAFVPTQPGNIGLGEVTLHFFNPETQQYEKVTRTLGTLNVTGSAENLNSQSFIGQNAQSNQSEVKRLGSDLIPPKILGNQKPGQPGLFAFIGGVFVFVSGLIVLAVSLFLNVKKSRKADLNNQRKKAQKQALSQLDSAATTTETFEAYRQALRYIFQIDSVSPTFKEVENSLSHQASVSDEIRSGVLKHYKDLEKSEYAPSGTQNNDTLKESIKSTLKEAIKGV